MSDARPKLSLFALDRPKLKELSRSLKELLASDDRKALAAELGLGAELADRIASGPRAVDWFLQPETNAEVAPLFASLRRVAKKRALELSWTSPAPSLEGRLRAFDVLRSEEAVARRIDKLLDSQRMPWFLMRPGATSGWLDNADREKLALDLRQLKPALPKEIAEFADALAEIDGDVVAHDRL